MCIRDRYSDDQGLSWNNANTDVPLIGDLYNIKIGSNGRWLIGALTGNLYSDDGLNFKYVISQSKETIYDAVYVNGLWYAIAAPNLVLVSSNNGLNWTLLSTLINFLSVTSNIQYNNNIFMTNSGENGVITSTTGASWTRLNNLLFGNIRKIHVFSINGTSRWFVLGRTVITPASNFGIAYSSNNGATWSTFTFPPNLAFDAFDLAYNGTRLVAIGSFLTTTGSFSTIYFSDNGGVTWSSTTIQNAFPPQSISFRNGTFLASFGIGSISSVFRSSDGVNFSNISSISNQINDLF